VVGRIPHPYLVYRVTWDAEHAARLRRTLEDPCLYATNPLFGADGEGAKFPIENPSVARARWVGLPDMPNCSVSSLLLSRQCRLPFDFVGIGIQWYPLQDSSPFGSVKEAWVIGPFRMRSTNLVRLLTDFSRILLLRLAYENGNGKNET
jgi:hypothetical protein